MAEHEAWVVGDGVKRPINPALVARYSNCTLKNLRAALLVGLATVEGEIDKRLGKGGGGLNDR